MQATTKPRPLIAGNWKMNGLHAHRRVLSLLGARVATLRNLPCEIVVCPPATLLAMLAETTRATPIQLGAQNCHPLESGPHTGDISAEMLADAGARYVIVGHSERRADHDESNQLIGCKAAAAWRAGLSAIVCVGETLAQRQAKQTLRVVGRQLRHSIPDGATAENLVVAYEPVWAIGTGLTPNAAEVAEVHSFLRRELVYRLGAEGEGVRILYGGSVNPGNAAELLAVADVDGALVGGASLAAGDFWAIVQACPGRESQ